MCETFAEDLKSFAKKLGLGGKLAVYFCFEKTPPKNEFFLFLISLGVDFICVILYSGQTSERDISEEILW